MTEAIFTVVSKPGPTERKLLDELGPIAIERRRVGAGVALRSIETAEQGSAAELVLLHGRGHSATVWAPFVRSFAARRHVLALDLPGFGHSGIDDRAFASASEALGLFVDPIEDLLARSPQRRVLVGHSLGGLVALTIALRGRVDIAGLVLVGSMGLGPYASPRARAYLRFGPERIARMGRMLGLASKGLSGGSASALRTELYLAGDRPVAKRSFDRLMPLVGDVFHLRDRLGEVKAPTLLVWGSRDEAFPLPIAMDARARLADAALEVMEAGHSPHIEDPEATMSLVRTFLAARVDPG